MSQICQERGGAFRMPYLGPHGTFRDERPRLIERDPDAPVHGPNQCRECGNTLDEHGVCGRHGLH